MRDTQLLKALSFVTGFAGAPCIASAELGEGDVSTTSRAENELDLAEREVDDGAEFSGAQDLINADEVEPTADWTEDRRAGDRHGGTGGRWFGMWCAPGDVAVGILGRSGVVIDRISLLCADVLANGALGSTYSAGNVGGNGGIDFSLRCSEGFALESIYGRSGDLLDRIGIRCRTIRGPNSYVGGSAGGRGGGEFWDPAVPGEFVTGMEGGSGNYVDWIKLHYSSF